MFDDIMLEMVDKFSGWLIQQLNQRGWYQAELARNAEVSRTAISDVISEKHTAGFDLCLAISRALKLPPEIVFRAAGLLPSKPEHNERITEATYILSIPGGALTLCSLRPCGSSCNKSLPLGSHFPHPPGSFHHIHSYFLKFLELVLFKICQFYLFKFNLDFLFKRLQDRFICLR